MKKMNITETFKKATKTSSKAKPIAIVATSLFAVAGVVAVALHLKNNKDILNIVEDDDADSAPDEIEEDAFKPSSFKSTEQASAYDEILSLFAGDEIKTYKYITSIYDTLGSADYIKALKVYKAINS